MEELRPLQIGIVTPYSAGEYFGSLMQGIHEEIVKIGGRMIVLYDREADYNSLVGISHMNGVIILNTDNVSLLEKVKSLKKPVISVNSYSEGIPVVSVDNRQGMEALTSHVIAHGHHRIAFVGDINKWDMNERYLGYLQTLRGQGIEPSNDWLISVNDVSEDDGYLAAKQMHENGMYFTAALCATDKLAAGMVTYFNDHQIQVPSDIVVCGFDGHYQSALSTPPITTVGYQTEQLGRMAVHCLREIIAGCHPVAEYNILSTELIIRSSCGCEVGDDYKANFALYSWMKERGKGPQRRFQENALHRISEIHARLIKTDIVLDEVLSLVFKIHMRWGCLGLWMMEDQNKDSTHKRLHVSHLFDDTIKGLKTVDRTLSYDSFPPLDALQRPLTETDIVTIFMVKTEQTQWGVLCLISTIGDMLVWESYETTSAVINLLGSVLERNELLDQLRLVHDQLEIVSRTSNDGIWYYDIHQNEIKLNSRLREVLRGASEYISINELKSMIVTEDLPSAISQYYRVHHECIPVDIDFRVMIGEETLWLHTTGDILRDLHGKPLALVGSVRNITEKKKAELQLNYLAYHDTLTGLPNRKSMMEYIASRIEMKLPFYFLLTDLNRFKYINDTFGHDVGDLYLRHFATTVKGQLGNDHFMARMGGDEFIIILSDESWDAVLQLINGIQKAFEEPIRLGDQNCYISLSVGCSMYPDDGDTFELLMKKADTAMYKAKSQNSPERSLVLFSSTQGSE